MTQQSYFYKEVTRLTESRIKELIQHAEDMEAQEIFPEASLYFRAHAVSVYLAWSNVTDGFRTNADLERLEVLINGNAFVD